MSNHSGESDVVWRSYRVDGLQLGPGGERVLVTAHDDAGDLLVWSAQPNRGPRIGEVVEITMRRQENPPSAEDSGREPVANTNPDTGSDNNP